MGTEIKQVNGFVGNNNMLRKGRILISVISQQDGEIVTLQEGNARMSVHVKDVEKLIEKARKGAHIRYGGFDRETLTRK